MQRSRRCKSFTIMQLQLHSKWGHYCYDESLATMLTICNIMNKYARFVVTQGTYIQKTTSAWKWVWTFYAFFFIVANVVSICFSLYQGDMWLQVCVFFPQVLWFIKQWFLVNNGIRLKKITKCCHFVKWLVKTSLQHNFVYPRAIGLDIWMWEWHVLSTNVKAW